MTLLLERAFGEAAKLPVIEQNTFAEWILAELESERRWDQLFADSQDLLAEMAAEALQELDEGRARDLDPDIL